LLSKLGWKRQNEPSRMEVQNLSSESFKGYSGSFFNGSEVGRVCSNEIVISRFRNFTSERVASVALA
jgi:hypothetical protein